MKKKLTNTVPQLGSCFSFRTAPLYEFATPDTRRYAAFKVLGSNHEFVVVGVLDSIWQNPPSMKEVCQCEVLREHRFLYQGEMAVFALPVDSWNESDLVELKLLGALETKEDEREIASRVFEHKPGIAFGAMCNASISAEGEWRWKHDRVALMADQAQKEAKDSAARAAQAERQRIRLRGLTWDILLNETPFERWSPSPPFPPKRFTQAARQIIHETCRSLRELGPKPSKREVRNKLRECVEWFNNADEQAGHVIETEEREDICAVLEEMAYVAKQKSLVDEIDEWRNW